MINAEKELAKAPAGAVSEVTLGTAYEINKNLVEKYEKELTEEELTIKKENIMNFINKFKDKYFMLLCKDRSDYTVFYLKESKIELINVLVDECLKNRGLIKGIDLTEDGCAVEIWLSIDEEAFCYYFFPYEAAVIKV